MPNWDGPDVSEWQGQPNWDQFAAAYPDVKFIGIKATQGQTYVDRSFRYNVSNVRRLIDAGWNSKRTLENPPIIIFYHFLDQWNTEVQAQHFYSTVGPLRNGETTALDIEPVTINGVITIPNLSVNHIMDCLSRIEGKFGRRPVAYYGYFYPGASDARFNDYLWWFPWYGVEQPPRQHRPYAIHQYGGMPTVGITPGRDVDANRVANYDALLKNSNSSAVINPPADVPSGAIDEGEDEMGAIYVFPGGQEHWQLTVGYVADAEVEDDNGTPVPTQINKVVYYFKRIDDPETELQLLKDGALKPGFVRQLAAGDDALDRFWHRTPHVR